ncbi:MAG TPA: hypothetical protein VGT41_01795 [Candidatus Babeliales bacterium]|nr:hypothetical protein [Candidatus Babeliales bacterium]
MHSIVKKIFLAIIAGAALQAGSSAYAANQLGGVYASGTTVALENVAKAFKSAGKAMRTVAQHETTQQVVDVIKNHGRQVAGRVALLGFFGSVSTLAAIDSFGTYCRYRDFSKRAETAKSEEEVDYCESKQYLRREAAGYKSESCLSAVAAVLASLVTGAIVGCTLSEGLPSFYPHIDLAANSL